MPGAPDRSTPGQGTPPPPHGPGRRLERFCCACGGHLETVPIEGRPRARCRRCGWVLYRNPASAAAGVVLDEGGQILLVRRAIQPYRGQWALPAGYQELDETPEQALVREVAEETGLEIEVRGLLDVLYVGDDPRKPANVHLFLAVSCAGTPEGADDVLEAAFFALDALPSPIGFDNYERILSKLHDPQRYPRAAWEELQRRLGAARSDGPT